MEYSKNCCFFTKDEQNVYTMTKDPSKKENSTSNRGIIQFGPFKDIMYFEMTILKASTNNPAMGLGFAPVNDWKKFGMPGWYDGSIGFHGDDAGVFDDISQCQVKLETYGPQDTVGAYWNTITNQGFFTKNGKKLDSYFFFRSVPCHGKMLPTVGFPIDCGDQITINYGSSPFVYDLSKENMQVEKKEFTEIETDDLGDFSLDLQSFVNNEMGSDIKFKTKDGHIVFGHTLIVSSRSKQLVELIKTGKEIEISSDKETLLRLLEYIYTGKTLLTTNNWQSVLLLADKFGFVELRKLCFEFIIRTLNKNTVLEVMIKCQKNGYEFDARDLLERCVKFVEKRAYEIIKTPSFLQLSEETIIMMLKNTNTLVDEYEIFEACLRWAENKKKNGDEREISEILKEIGKWFRYPYMGANELVKKVKPLNICPDHLYKQALEHIAYPSGTHVDLLKEFHFQPRYSLFPSSSIIDSKMAWILKGWLPYTKKGWTLLYKASKDGFLTQTFHQKCDNKGDTVTIIQSENGNIFGGYNPLPWSQNNNYTNDKRTFLFSLVNKLGKPTKVDNYTQYSNSAYNGSGYATFGGGHDIYIVNQSNTVNSSYCNSGYSFKIVGMPYGSTQANQFYAGSYNFKTKEIEVYGRAKE